MRLRPTDTGSALVFGGAVDVGLNSLLNDKKDGREPSLERAKTMFDAEFGATDPNTIKYSKADLDPSLIEDLQVTYNPPAWHSLQAKGHMILTAYLEQVIPRIEKVILVQHEISLKNEFGDALIGVVDLVATIDGKTYILDNKTSSIKYSEDSASISQQLGTYFEALKDEYKLDGVGFIVIPKNIRKKKEPRVPIEMVFGSVGESVLSETFKMYETVLDGIKNGRFECSRNCCKQPWPCVYKTYCDSGGTDLTGLKYQEKK